MPVFYCRTVLVPTILMAATVVRGNDYEDGGGDGGVDGEDHGEDHGGSSFRKKRMLCKTEKHTTAN